MSDIAKSMTDRGYTPLAADRLGGIGFRKSLGRQSRALPRPVWFDTGFTMKGRDAHGNATSVARTVCASDEARYRQYIERGWRPAAGERTGEGA